MRKRTVIYGGDSGGDSGGGSGRSDRSYTGGGGVSNTVLGNKSNYGVHR